MGTVLLQNITETKNEHDALSKQAAIVSGKITDLIRQIDETKAKIEDADQRYDDACRTVAAGKNADPHAILTEKANLNHKLHGLEQLLQAARAEESPLIARIAELVTVILDEQERQKEAELIANRDNTFRGLESARKALSEAEALNNAAVAELSNFRNQIQHRDVRRHRGQE